MSDDVLDGIGLLIVSEAFERHINPERMAVLAEALARFLGNTIAIAARGDPRRIDVLVEGSTAYAHREAVEKAPEIRRLIAEARR